MSILIALFWCLFLGAQAINFGCLNEEGVFVDWWVIYKISNGLDYVYLDSTMSEPQGLNGKEINSPLSPLTRTVFSSFPSRKTTKDRHQMYDPFYVSWNDGIIQNPMPAHAKGFIGIKQFSQNSIESFFIQHSLPRFPFQSEALYDTNINSRAQHFFCISMKDEFVAEETKTRNKNILPENVKDCNFFKILWDYATVIKIRSFCSESTIPDNFKSIFQVLEKGLRSNKTKLSSFCIESTSVQNPPLKIQILAKAPDNHIDIYDDVTSLLSIHHEDYIENETGHKTGHYDKDKVAILMITQSHTDPATLGINHKVLVQKTDFLATVHILNSASINLPTIDRAKKKNQLSVHRDHSKWSVNVIYGSEGEFPALFCFYDLNRSHKQATRGGGAFCLNSSFTGTSPGSTAIWNMFISFGPKPTDMARFVNSPINMILPQLVPSYSSTASFADSTISSNGSRRKRKNLSGQTSDTSISSCKSSSAAFLASESDTDAFDSPVGRISFSSAPCDSSTTDESFIIGSDHQLDSEAVSAMKSSSIFAEASVKKSEMLDNFPRIRFMTYLMFSNESADESSQPGLMIFHPHDTTPTRISSPYKFQRGQIHGPYPEIVPKIVGLKINEFVCCYGLEKLNNHLNDEIGIRIVSTKLTKSPFKSNGHMINYDSALKVSAKKVSKSPASALKRCKSSEPDSAGGGCSTQLERYCVDGCGSTYLERYDVNVGGSTPYNHFASSDPDSFGTNITCKLFGIIDEPEPLTCEFGDLSEIKKVSREEKSSESDNLDYFFGSDTDAADDSGDTADDSDDTAGDADDSDVDNAFDADTSDIADVDVEAYFDVGTDDDTYVEVGADPDTSYIAKDD